MALTQSQLDTITRTVLGEAANQGPTGMAAVAAVVKNRAESGQWSSDPATVAASHEFSANLPVSRGGNLQGRNASPNSAIYQQALRAVQGVFDGSIPDPTGGATYYHVTGTSAPAQDAMTRTAQIGAHSFFSPDGGIPAAAYASPDTPQSSALTAIMNATSQTPSPDPSGLDLNSTFGAGSFVPPSSVASLSPDIPSQMIMGNDITPSGSAAPLAASGSGGGLANLPSQSTAAPIPMDRLRVAPSDILSAVKQFASGSNVNLNAVSPAQQQALVSALPTLMAFPDGTDGQVAALKYLQDNNLLNPLLAVVPTQDVNPMMRGIGQMKYGVPIPPTIPQDVSAWGLPGSPSQLPTEIAALTNPDQYRRPISPNDGAQPSSAIPSAPPAPIGMEASLSNIGAGGGVAGLDAITPNLNSALYTPPAMDAYALPGPNGSILPPSLDNPFGSTPVAPSANVVHPTTVGSMNNSVLQNSLPYADTTSLNIPSSVQVPQYTTISKQVQVPSSQPISTGSGVHWDDAAQNYVLDAPVAPTYKTVTEQVPNPAYKAPAPVTPMSIDPDYLAYLQAQAENPLEKWFGGTPLGKLTGFLGSLGGQAQAPSAPTPYVQPGSGNVVAKYIAQGLSPGDAYNAVNAAVNTGYDASMNAPSGNISHQGGAPSLGPGGTYLGSW